MVYAMFHGFFERYVDHYDPDFTYWYQEPIHALITICEFIVVMIIGFCMFWLITNKIKTPYFDNYVKKKHSDLDRAMLDSKDRANESSLIFSHNTSDNQGDPEQRDSSTNEDMPSFGSSA